MDSLPKNHPYLFIIEGMANYLREDDLCTILKAIASHFSKSEIVMEALGWLYVKMTKSPQYKWGMSADSHPDKWDQKIQIVNSWCMFGRYPERWREFIWAAPLMAFRKTLKLFSIW